MLFSISKDHNYISYIKYCSIICIFKFSLFQTLNQLFLSIYYLCINYPTLSNSDEINLSSS